MNPEEYLFVCLIFSIVFVTHSAISYIARVPAAFNLKKLEACTPMLRVNLARVPFQ
jgi:hypothetical protein